jgi:lysozyme family protein
MVDLVALQRRNDVRWKNMLFARSPNDFDARAKIAYKNRWRYIAIVHMLQALGSNMPDDAWVFIAAAHERESSMNFNTHLGQGDPLTNRNGVPIKTVHVPANRGPFSGPDAFEKAAVDALWYCAPYAAKNNKDWSISGMLTYLERYNGIGYAMRGLPSPYLWAGSNQYTSGKYIADGVFSATAKDTQLGVAGLLKRIDFMDGTINFGEMPEVPLAPALPTGLSPIHGVHDAVWAQWALNETGAVPKLDTDGVLGPNSRMAIRVYQAMHGLKVNGIVDAVHNIPSLVAELKKAGKPEFPTEKELA